MSTKLHDSWTLQGRESLLSLQTSVPRLQKQSTCMVVSTCLPQASHVLESVIFLWKRESLVGKIPLHVFHTKCLILFGKFIHHTPHQTPCIFDGFEQLVLPPSAMISRANLYALLTVKLTSFLSSAHTILSFATDSLMGILRIASASYGRKRPLTSSVSHSKPSSLSNSLTILIWFPGLSGVTTL